MTSSSERKPDQAAGGRDPAGEAGVPIAARQSQGRDPAARTRRFDEPKGASFAERAAADAALHARSPFGAGSAASFTSGTGAGAGARAGTGAGTGAGAANSAAPAGAGGNYARFIPREEVKSFAAWTPGSFGAASPRQEPGAGESAPAAPPTPAELAAQLQAARQSGYQDGYRDGLVALEAFKQSYAQQITAQMVTLAGAYRAQLEQLECGLAVQVAEVAVALARQVVRSELATRPEFVAAVAQEALAAAVVAAQQVTVHLHPADHALVQAHAGEALAARGARLVPDAALARGGCVVETEMGVIDASIEARWRRASAAMGRPSDFEVQVPGEGSGS